MNTSATMYQTTVGSALPLLKKTSTAPIVGPAPLREGRAELGEQQRLGNEEDDREDHHPGEGLTAARRHRGDRVHADDGADEEEQDVVAAEVLLQLLPFDIGDGQVFQGCHRDVLL